MHHYLASLHLLPGMTHERLRRLSDKYAGDFQQAWETLSASTLIEIGIKDHIDIVLQKRALISPEAAKQYMESRGIDIIVEGDADYPEFFYEIKPRAFLLYMRGNKELLLHKRQRVALVGSRKVSSYGKRVVKQLLSNLAVYGIVTVSGLAYGVDAACHRESIASGVSTMGVLGTGIDVAYPTSHRSLMEDIVEDGLLLSEFPLGAKARPYHFPLRNRMVAAISEVTVVVEAAEKSGSLITASLALELGREVGAVPGDIFSPTCHGTNSLIAKGEAAVVRDGSDILALLGIDDSKQMQSHQIGLEGPLSHILSYVPMEHDEVVVLSAMDVVTCSQELSLLELDGLICKVDGTKWVRC